MFAKYVWLNGATLTQVLDDICKVATGTSVASLSASCDKVNSSIVANTGSNNWTVYDAAAAASAQVLRSLNMDGVSYKFAHISYSGANLLLSSHESWNAATHVGTNQAANTSTIPCIPKVHTAFATTGGTIYIYASNNVLLLMQSNTSRAMVGEFSRDTVALNSTYPCHVVAGDFKGLGSSTPVANEQAAGICRIKSSTDVGDFKIGAATAVTTHSCMVGTIGSAYDLINTSIQIRATPIRAAGTETTYCQLSDLFVYCYGLAGKIQGMFYLEGAPASNLGDELTISGTTYLLFGNYIVRKE